MGAAPVVPMPAAAPPAPASSWAPTAKVAAGPLAGAISLILLSVLKTHQVTWATAEVGGAITTIITFVVQYVTPERD